MSDKRKPFIASVGTTTSVGETIQQLQAIVERFNAREFRIIYGENSKPIAVRFAINDPNLPWGEGFFTVELAAPSEAILMQLKTQRVREDARRPLPERAERAAWRQLHDYVRAVLISVQWGMVTVGEAFMGGLVVTLPDGRETRFADAMTDAKLLTPRNGRLLLGSGS